MPVVKVYDEVLQQWVITAGTGSGGIPNQVTPPVNPTAGDLWVDPSEDINNDLQTTFIALRDTPSTYTGSALKIARVNNSETALEFVDNVDSQTSFLNLTDTPDVYAGNTGKAVIVKGDATGLEFGNPTSLYEPAKYCAKLLRTSPLAMPAYGWQTISWNSSAILDAAVMWNASSPTNIVVPTGCDRADITINLRRDSGLSSDLMINGAVYLNGVEICRGLIQTTTSTGGWPGLSLSTGVFEVTQNDIITIKIEYSLAQEFSYGYVAVECWSSGAVTMLHNGYKSNLVKEIVLTQDTQTVTFTGLDIVSDLGYVLECYVKDPLTGCSSIINFNGDTTAGNYKCQQIYADGGTLSTTGIDTGATTPYIHYTEAGGRSFTKIEIGFISGYVSAMSTGVRVAANNNPVQNHLYVSYAVSVANLTSITIKAYDGPTVHRTGSVFRLYRKKQHLSIPLKSSDLADMPTSFTGQAGKALIVNPTEDAIVIGTAVGTGSGASAFVDLTDAPSTYVGSVGKYPRVKSTADGIEFYTPVHYGNTEPVNPSLGTVWVNEDNLDKTGATVLLGGMTGALISEKILTSDSATIAFTDLNSLTEGDYTLEVNALGFNVSDAGIGLTVNGDFTNFQTRWSENNKGGAYTFNSTWPQIGVLLSKGSYPSACVLTCKVRIMDGRIVIHSVGSFHRDATNHYGVFDSGVTSTIRSHTSITSLTVFGPSLFLTGTVARLYGSITPTKLVAFSPKNVTGFVANKYLAPGEIAYLDYSLQTIVPLRIRTEEGLYEVDIIGDISVSGAVDQDVFFRPNDSEQTGIIQHRQYQIVSATITGQYSNRTNFIIGNQNIGFVNLKMSTFTKTKCCNSMENSRRIATANYLSSTGTHMWTDTTTPWTSLGTIIFPFAQSGKVVIRRTM